MEVILNEFQKHNKNSAKNWGPRYRKIKRGFNLDSNFIKSAVDEFLMGEG
jgi:hypothetical protein